jgi:1-acyl-sn-glycerol-3-phosphate acyltransferase
MRPPTESLQRLTKIIQQGIGACMPFIMRRSMRQGLHAIWHKGDWEHLPKSGLIFASNHPSWWDMYVCWWIGQHLKRPLSGIFHDETLKTFPFFRSIGGIGQREIREALRRLDNGHILQIFPSGDMQYKTIKHSHEGIAYLAEKSRVAVYPVALHVVVRGAQKPEVFVILGEKLEFNGSRSELITQIENSINQILENLEQQLLQTHPEARPEGFEAWLGPALRFDQRIAMLRKFWDTPKQ